MDEDNRSALVQVQACVCVCVKGELCMKALEKGVTDANICMYINLFHDPT